MDLKNEDLSSGPEASHSAKQPVVPSSLRGPTSIRRTEHLPHPVEGPYTF